jgi:hypothetical protein
MTVATVMWGCQGRMWGSDDLFSRALEHH